MSRKYFGTDGIRGRVGEGAISADFVLRLGNAYGLVQSDFGFMDASPDAQFRELARALFMFGREGDGADDTGR